jgi:hypothetical protein
MLYVGSKTCSALLVATIPQGISDSIIRFSFLRSAFISSSVIPSSI